MSPAIIRRNHNNPNYNHNPIHDRHSTTVSATDDHDTMTGTRGQNPNMALWTVERPLMEQGAKSG